MNSSRSQACARPVLKSLGNNAQSFTPDQAYLFSDQAPVIPGSLNDEHLVRSLVTEAISASAKSRDQIADEMSTLAGDRITVRMLNSYTSEAAEQHRWPLQYTRAFCHVVKDWTLLRCIAERAGYHLISDNEAELLELGRQYLRRKRADEQTLLLEKRLSGVDL